MQFTGGKGITLFVALIVFSCAVGFGSGLLVGRQFPAHRFEKFGETRYLLDPTAGKLCDPFKDPKSPNPIDQALTAPPESLDKFLGNAAKPTQSNYPPPCPR